MSVQNVDKHLEKFKTCCRVCAKKLGKGARKTNAKYLQNDIFFSCVPPKMCAWNGSRCEKRRRGEG